MYVDSKSLDFDSDKFSLEIAAEPFLRLCTAAGPILSFINILKFFRVWLFFVHEFSVLKFHQLHRLKSEMGSIRVFRKLNRSIFFELPNSTKLNRVKTYRKLRNVLKYQFSMGLVRIFFEPNRDRFEKLLTQSIPSLPQISYSALFK